MSQIDKLKRSFRNCRSTFRYCDLEKLLGTLGFERVRAGKTGGSRRKFIHAATRRLIFLDEPHDGEMKLAMVRRIRETLEELGLL